MIATMEGASHLERENMTLNPAILKSVENLGYRVTVGDIAAQAGLEINLAQRGLLALASDAGGHLQVADSGEIVYLFPQDFRTILRNKFWRLRLKEWWEKVWKILFYLIRISFGIVLITFIIIVTITIIVIMMSGKGDNDNNSRGSSRSSHYGGGGGGGIFFMPNLWSSWFLFNPGYSYYEDEGRSRRTNPDHTKSNLNFLEAIFSFLFGDGNPNFDLEERRWQEIGTVIRNQGGAVTAQQIAPYLDNVDRLNEETEDYIIPVLARFNGYPQVSPEGEIIYYFPDLQVMAKKRQSQSVSAYLREKLWRFSEADSGQIMMATGLGVVYLILTLVLGSMLKSTPITGGLVGFVGSIYGVFLGYALGFLVIPLIRYFWVQWRNQRIESRNQQRQARAEFLNQADENLQKKLAYARQFAAETVITDEDITYSTDKDVLEQEIERSDKIDQEWQRRLEGK